MLVHRFNSSLIYCTLNLDFMISPLSPQPKFRRNKHSTLLVKMEVFMANNMGVYFKNKLLVRVLGVNCTGFVQI